MATVEHIRHTTTFGGHTVQAVPVICAADVVVADVRKTLAINYAG
jgi:hypothetical protein